MSDISKHWNSLRVHLRVGQGKGRYDWEIEIGCRGLG